MNESEACCESLDLKFHPCGEDVEDGEDAAVQKDRSISPPIVVKGYWESLSKCGIYTESWETDFAQYAVFDLLYCAFSSHERGAQITNGAASIMTDCRICWSFLSSLPWGSYALLAHF